MRLTDLSELIATGGLTPLELVERCLARIVERDGEVRAWTHLAADQTREEAVRLGEELKTSGPRSPLHGIPIGVKDIFDVAGMLCEWGSPVERGRTPAVDSDLIAKFRELGAIVLGKTHTTAYAYFDPAPTRNPRNLGHTPGGSSSGSAAAVADGMVPLAIGSQTMGSVLRPASFCGAVGFKPSFGALPLQGVMPFAPSLDHPGLFAANVADAALAWSALHGVSRPLEPRRAKLIALPWPIEGELEPPMREAFQTTLKKLRADGWEVEQSPLPDGFAALQPALLTVMTAEGAITHGAAFRRHGSAIGVKLAGLIEMGLAITAEELEAARRTVQAAKESFAAFAAGGAVIATPSALGPAPAGLGSTGDPRCNAPWTALGVPAVSLPAARSPQGLPLGLQLTARRGAEDELLSCAAACESVIGSV